MSRRFALRDRTGKKEFWPSQRTYLEGITAKWRRTENVCRKTTQFICTPLSLRDDRGLAKNLRRLLLTATKYGWENNQGTHDRLVTSYEERKKNSCFILLLGLIYFWFAAESYLVSDRKSTFMIRCGVNLTAARASHEQNATGISLIPW